MMGRRGLLGLVAATCLACPGIASAALSWSSAIAVDHKALTAVACPTSAQCTAVDAVGNESTFDPAPGSPAPVTARIDTNLTGSDPPGVDALACPVVAECVAVDQNGQEVTFNPTAPGKPAPALIDQSDNGGYALTGV